MIAIVGAGIAGLLTAFELTNSGINPSDITIFDKHLSCGGRLCSVFLDKSAPVMELGAGRIHEELHSYIMSLCKELQLKLEPFCFPTSWSSTLLQESCPTSVLLKNLLDNLIQHSENGLGNTLVSDILTVNDVVNLKHWSGYDLVSNHSIDFACKILSNHPETQYLLGNKESFAQWWKLPEGFSMLAQKLQNLLKDKGVYFFYEMNLKEINKLENNFELVFQNGDRIRKHVSDKIILALPLSDVHAIKMEESSKIKNLTYDRLLMMKGYLEFTYPWWMKNHQLNIPQCIIGSTPFKKVYLFDQGNAMLFYSDSESAIELENLLNTKSPKETIKMLESHLGVSIPLETNITNIQYKSWKQGVELLHQPSSSGFLELMTNIYVCSSCFTSKTGWIEGAAMSAKLITKEITK